MLGELEDTDEARDAEKGERRARLGAGTTHRDDDIEQRHVVRYYGRHVYHVLEVLPELQLARTRHEPYDRLDGEPRGAGRLDDEERVEEVGCLVLFAVRLGKIRQRLDAEQNDGGEGDADGEEGDGEPGPRCLRVFEQLPQVAQGSICRQDDLVIRVAFGAPVFVDYTLNEQTVVSTLDYTLCVIKREVHTSAHNFDKC